MKPGVVFFGEKMPQEFFVQSRRSNLEHVDLLFIIGTSLKVKLLRLRTSMIKSCGTTRHSIIIKDGSKATVYSHSIVADKV